MTEELTRLWDLYGVRFVQGAFVTLEITVVAVALGVVIGLALALTRLYAPHLLAAIAIGYIELFRGTPLLVQLFIVYYGLPAFGILLDNLPAAFLTLGMNTGAYQAEYFRGAIKSIDPGQLTAARAVGMSQAQALRYILLPQALRVALPPWSNEVIGVMKASAVVFLIAVQDLMAQAKIIFGRTFDPVEAYVIVTIVYLAMIAALTFLLSRLEGRLRIPGMEIIGQHR
jgi:polar amino acid transport system permease protein